MPQSLRLFMKAGGKLAARRAAALNRRVGRIKYVLLRVPFVLLLLAPLAACSERRDPPGAPNQNGVGSRLPARDWGRFPAVVERDVKTEVIALGDVHGGYKRLVNLLSGAGLIKPDPGAKAGYAWSGGSRVLVCTGDLIDKGDQSLEVLDLMMALEQQAPAAGGEVIITAGNHEAEFLADPENKKAGEFRVELKARGIDPESLLRGAQPYGEWLSRRPFAARVNNWFFSHAGNSAGKTIPQLSQELRDAVDHSGWNSAVIIGDDSLLEARLWWKSDDGSAKLLDDYLRALKVNHIVFGHDPGAFHERGVIGQEKDGRIFLIDVGMSPAVDYSKGALLVIDQKGDETTAASLDADQRRSLVWDSHEGPIIKRDAHSER